MRFVQSFTQKRSLYLSVSFIAVMGISLQAGAELKINPYPQAKISAAPVTLAPPNELPDVIDLMAPKSEPTKAMPEALAVPAALPDDDFNVVVEPAPEVIEWRAPRAVPSHVQDEFDREFQDIELDIVDLKPVRALDSAPPPPAPSFAAVAGPDDKPQPGRYRSEADYLVKHGYAVPAQPIAQPELPTFAEAIADVAPSAAPDAFEPETEAVFVMEEQVQPVRASTRPAPAARFEPFVAPPVAAPAARFEPFVAPPVAATSAPQFEPFVAPPVAAAPQPATPPAPQPQKMASLAPSPLDSLFASAPEADPRPEVEPLPVETLVREVRPYELPVEPVQRLQSWHGFAGANLNETLEVWAMHAGVDLIWASHDSAFNVRDTVSVESSFEEAVADLLGQYEDADIRPVGSLYVDPQSGVRTLVIEVLEE